MVRKQLRENVAHAITTAREAKDMTQGELARMVKTSRQSVCAYEVGLFLPRLEIMLRIARVLDIDINQLIDRGERL